MILNKSGESKARLSVDESRGVSRMLIGVSKLAKGISGKGATFLFWNGKG